MSWEHINLNMTPGGEMPIVHVSQFDTYRAFTFNLFVGEDEWTIPEGIRFELHCRKVDDNIVIIEPDLIDASSVTFITTEQLTACAGKNKCELVAIDTDDDTLIVGSINFILDVEADPLAGGVTSETAIDNLTQQIEDIAQEVIGDDYYNKTEVDTLLADKADVSDLPDMSLYYTKTATDSLLNAKADKTDTYTKAQVDSALAAKANTADLATVATSGDYDDLLNKPTIPAAQVQSDYAQADNTAVDYIKNKPDIDAMIAAALLAVMPVDSATGNPCSFDTDIATSLVGLSAEIVASGGNGTPSTPIPIVGHSELNLVRCGKNLLDAEVSAITPSLPISAVTQNINIGADCVFSMTASADYANSDNYWLVYIQKLDGTRTYITPTAGQTKTQAFTVTSDNPITAIYYRNSGVTAGSVTNFQIELGTSPSAYAPYNGTPYLVSFGQTVYGGEYDANAGKLTITHKVTTLTDMEQSTIGGVIVFTKTLTDAKAPASNSEIGKIDMSPYTPVRYSAIKNEVDHIALSTTLLLAVNTGSATPPVGEVRYELATPIEIDVSSISVNAVSGVNNIISDCNGDVTASYKVSIQKYVDDHV